MAKYKKTSEKQIVLSYREKLDSVTKDRYDKKLSVMNLETCPYEINDGWTESMKFWPDVSYPQIVHYLIETPGVFTLEKMKCQKSLESYNYFDSGYVRTVYSRRVGKDKVLLISKVDHSQKTSELPCNVWIGVKSDGSVIASHCDCMAGLGEACSHVGAVLYKIEASIRLGLNKESCTSVECKWNQQGSKKIEPKRIVDIDFSAPNRNKKTGLPRKTPSKVKEPTPPTAEEREKLFQQLHESNINAVVLTTHDKYYIHYKPAAIFKVPDKLPTPLNKRFKKSSDIHMATEDLLMQSKAEFQNLSITSEEAKYIESVTHNQTDSIVWHEQRYGRITASKIYDVIHTKENQPAKTVINSICTSNFTSKSANIPSLKWGLTHEQDGINDLCLMLSYGNTTFGNSKNVNSVDIKCQSVSVSDKKDVFVHRSVQLRHEDPNIHKCGLYIKPDIPYIGASPDRVLTCKCCGRILVEVKCPYSHRSSNKLSDFKDEYFNENLNLKKTHRWYYQVQTQLNVTEVEFCFFIVWTPKLTVISLEQVNREWFKEKLSKLQSFYIQNILPVLISGQIDWQSSGKRSPLKATENIARYCLCNGVEDDRVMVRCSNFRSCSKVWFHLDCLKLSSAPKGRWLCPYCKK